MKHAPRRRGLTLVELLVVLVILAILTTIAITSSDQIVDQGRYDATQRTLRNIQDAIMGPANQRAADGSLLITGFVADMGRLPQTVDGTSDPLRELWDSLVIPTIAIYGQQQFPTTATPKAMNSGSAFGLLSPPGPYNSSTTNVPVTVTMPCGWRGPYLQLGPGSAGRLLDGYGNPFDSMFQPSSGAPIIMTIGGQPAANGQPNPGGPPNPFPQQVNVVCSRGADNTLDTVVQSNPNNVDQYAPPQVQAPLWTTATPLTSTPTPLLSFSDNAYGSVSIVVQTVNEFGQPVTFGNPVAKRETTPAVRVVLFAPSSGVLNAYILDSSSTAVSGVPTLNLNALPTTSAVDFSLPAPPAAPTLGTPGMLGTPPLQPGTYYVKYQDFVGSTSLGPSLGLKIVVAAGTAPTITMPAPASTVTIRNIYLTAPNGAWGTETLYMPLSGTSPSVTSYTLQTAYVQGGAPPSSSTSVFGTFLNVPIGHRAIQAFQYDASTMLVTKRSPLTFITVPAGGTMTQTLILQ